MKQRFVQDYDSHWYLINANMVEHFAKWLEHTEKQMWVENIPEWEGFDFNTKRLGCCPSRYTFENPVRE